MTGVPGDYACVAATHPDASEIAVRRSIAGDTAQVECRGHHTCRGGHRWLSDFIVTVRAGSMRPWTDGSTRTRGAPDGTSDLHGDRGRDGSRDLTHSAYERVRAGELPALRLGRRIVITRAVVDAMLGGTPIASTMWAMRSSSRGSVIHRLGFGDDVVAEPATESPAVRRSTRRWPTMSSSSSISMRAMSNRLTCCSGWNSTSRSTSLSGVKSSRSARAEHREAPDAVAAAELVRSLPGRHRGELSTSMPFDSPTDSLVPGRWIQHVAKFSRRGLGPRLRPHVRRRAASSRGWRGRVGRRRCARRGPP